jgi:beta propeller repeat protein
VDAANRARERCNGVDDDGDGRVDEGCPIRLTHDPRHDVYPSIWGTTVAWSRIEAQFVGDVGDVYVRTLPDGVEQRVAQGVAYPRIAGHRVAYLRDGHIAVLDLATGLETAVDTPDASYVQAPFITERYLAWSQVQRGTDEDYEVVALDLQTGQRMRVGVDPTIQMFPLVEGDRVAWQDDRRGHHTVGLLHLFDVYAASLVPAMDLVPAEQISARDGTDTQYDVPTALDQGRVLVAEWHGPVASPEQPHTCVPVLFDLATHARTALAEETPECFAPGTLAGSRAVLVFDPDGVSDLYLFDLRAGRRTQLTTYNRRSIRPRLSRDGNYLVWQDDRNEDWELYFMDLTDADAGDLSPEGVTP